MVKKYRVGLTGEEQEELRALVSKGRAAAYKQTRARILLLSDENQSGEPMMDQEISRALKVGTATVERVRRRCVEEGVEAALGRREQLRRSADESALPWPYPRGTGQLDHANLADGFSGCGQHQPGDSAPDWNSSLEGVLVPSAPRQRRIVCAMEELELREY